MERIRRVLKLVFRNIYYYRVDYIRVFIAVRLLQILAVIPLVSLLFTVLLRTMGVQAVTEQNIWQLLGHPLVLTVLLCIVVIILVFIYYEMGMLMLLAYHQQKAIPYTLMGLLKRLNQKVLYFLSFQTLIFLLYLLLAVPLISSVLPLSITQNIQIPRFIVDELVASVRGRAIYVGAISVLLVVGLRFIFLLPFFTVYHRTTIWESAKLSWQFSKRKLVDTLAMLGVILIVHVAFSVTILAVIFLPLFVLEKLYSGSLLIPAAITLTFAEGILIVAFSLLQAMFSQLLILVAFRLTRNKPLIEQNESFRQSVRQRMIALASVAFLVTTAFNVYNLSETIYEPDTMVIAHRGFMEKGVENTLSAFIAATEVGAEMVEIDIQQTKDGKFVVFHDATLSRLAGKKASVYQMTQQELQQVTVSMGGLSDNIPSLEAMLEASREYDTKLLIEIKTHGYETDDFLQRLIDLLNNYQMVDLHYIQSLDVQMVEHLKKMEPRLKVGAVYAMNIGELPKTSADFIAIEQFFVSEHLIEKAKEQGKELFVWTVNDNRGLHRFLEQNVTGIITNQPNRAVQIRDALDDGEYFFKRVWNKINYIF